MELRELLKKARGGRVVASGFLDLKEQEELRLLARREGLELAWFGGLRGAERKVGVLHPAQIPRVSADVWVGWLESAEPEAAAAALKRSLAAEQLGDVRVLENGVLFAASAAARKTLESAGILAGEPPAELLRGREKTRSIVVPSLRVDALGSKGFGVSRSYFAKGVKAGKVRLRGKVASVSDEVRQGDTLVAEGLGQVTLVRLGGLTKRGNYKVELRFEK